MLRKIAQLTATAALIFAASAPAFAQGSCDPTVNHYRAGSDLYAGGSYAAAFESFGCFLSLYPADAYPQQTAEVLNMRGNALREQGDLAGALEQYSEAITVQPDYAIAYNNRGWAHFLLGGDEPALADYTLAISYDPDLAYAYNNRGLLYQFRGDLRLAAGDFERALALGLDPAQWAEYNLSLVELVENRAVPLTPDTGTQPSAASTLDALLNEGIAAHDAGAWSETVAIMSDVLAQGEGNATAHYLRGRAYIALDRFEDAFADFDQLVQLAQIGVDYPSLQYAYWERAIAAAQIGNFDLARLDATAALTIEPGHVNNFIARGTIAALEGDDATAASEFLALMLCWEQERITLDPVQISETVRIEMSEGRIVTLPFEAEDGQVITISAVSRSADPVIVLLDPAGVPLSGDDDGGFMLSSLIEDYELAVDGTYTIQVSHAGGGSDGIIAVSINAE